MKLFVDGVEIPWPKKIEVQVDEAGETVGPVHILVLDGQLVIQGNEKMNAGLLVEGRLKHPPSLDDPDFKIKAASLVLRAYEDPRQYMGGFWDGDKLVPVEERGSRGKVLFEEDKLPDVKVDGRVRTVTGYDACTKTITLADPVEDLPTPDVVAREGEPC